MRRKSVIDWRVSCASALDLVAQVADLVALVVREFLPAGAGQASDAAQPVGVELVADILLQEIDALDAVRFGQTQQLALRATAAAG